MTVLFIWKRKMQTETKEKYVVLRETEVVELNPCLIEFPIGDWSGDGHEKCEYFRVHSTHDVEVVREAHFAFKTKFGFDIGDMASDYEEPYISHEQLDILRNHNILDYILPEHDESGFYDEECGFVVENPEDMLDIWLRCLMIANPSIQLSRAKELPSINFYGFDEQKRHLNTPGYGLFYL